MPRLSVRLSWLITQEQLQAAITQHMDTRPTTAPAEWWAIVGTHFGATAHQVQILATQYGILPPLMHCRAPDCTEPVASGGYCYKHYKRWRNNGTLVPRTRERQPLATCHPERTHVSHGLCRECYDIKRREQAPRRRRNEPPQPAECHPDRPAARRGLCAQCYDTQRQVFRRAKQKTAREARAAAAALATKETP